MKHRLARGRGGVIGLIVYFGLLLAGFEIYHVASMHAPRQSALAHQHADALVRLEQRLGILVEPRVQRFALHHPHPSILPYLLDNAAIRFEAQLIYAGGQMPWLASMLLWLLLFRPQYIKRMCVLAIVGSLAGILIAAFYPVAPPRFTLAGSPYHVEDVSAMLVSEQALVQHGGFNPYAAMPSLHVVWALIAALGLWVGTARWELRVLSCLFPTSIVAAVIITGNHYILDCLASVLLLAGLLLCYRIWTWLCRARRDHVVGVDAAPATNPSGGPERRRRPNLRPLDCPVLLCAITGAALIPSVNLLQRALGLLLLAAGAFAPPVALKRIRAGTIPYDSTPTLEWWSGFLLVVGATTLGADDVRTLEIGSLCWTIAALLPLLARMRGRPHAARETRRTEVGMAATYAPPNGSG